MKLILRIYMIFCTSVLTFYILALAIFLAVSNIERAYLPSGVSLGRKYIISGHHEVYFWKKNGDLLIDEPIDFICANDHFIDASLRTGGSIFYDIRADRLYPPGDPEMSAAFKNSSLNHSGQGCGGYVSTYYGAASFLENRRRMKEFLE